MKKLSLYIIIPLVIAACIYSCSSQQSLKSKISPTVKSIPAMSSIDDLKSGFIPQNFLAAPGFIVGTWFSETMPSKMKISVDNQIAGNKKCKNFPEDCLVITFPDKETNPVEFRAAFGSFFVYGFDTDGDGLKEIAIESAESRDSNIKYLRVMKLVRGDFIEIFRAQLNGFLNSAISADKETETVEWSRKYFFKQSFTGKKLDIVFTLDTSPERLHRISLIDDLLIFQLKKITVRYDEKNLAFSILDFTHLPLK